MNLKEIVTRDPNAPVDQDELLFVIREYIKIRRGVNIKPIKIRTYSHYTKLRDVRLMAICANIAIDWLRIEHFKIPY